MWNRLILPVLTTPAVHLPQAAKAIASVSQCFDQVEAKWSVEQDFVSMARYGTDSQSVGTAAAQAQLLFLHKVDNIYLHCIVSNTKTLTAW